MFVHRKRLFPWLLLLIVSLPYLLGSSFTGPSSFSAGSGSGTYKPGGTLFWEQTNIANAADTLYIKTATYTLPALTMTTDGDRISIEANLTFSATAATKTYYCNIGFTAFDTTGGFTGGINVVGAATATTDAGVTSRSVLTRISATATSTYALADLAAGGGATFQSGAWTTGAITWANAQPIACITKSSVGTASVTTLNEFRVIYEPR